MTKQNSVFNALEQVPLSKSWKITIIAFAIALALPLINSQLPDGIRVTQETVDHFLAIFIGSGTIGAATSIAKKTIQLKHAQNGLIPQAYAQSAPAGAQNNTHLLHLQQKGHVAWKKINGWLETNGTTLGYESPHLWVRVKDSKSYVTAVLRDANKRVIQVDQSSAHDEDQDDSTTRLELFNSNGTPLARGRYYLSVKSDSTKGGPVQADELAVEIV